MDAFHSSAKKPGSAPFGGPGYSDQFVRSATQPLTSKGTRPLAAGPESVAQQITDAEQQLAMCRTILEQFEPRIGILKSAVEHLKKPAAPPPPKKLGFGAKKPAPPARQAAGDRAMIENLAQRLGAKPDLLRRSEIALHQFDDALSTLTLAETKLAGLTGLDPYAAGYALDGLGLSKLQGKVYPICNFYEVFKDDEMLWRLFPPPQQTSVPRGTGRLSLGG
ncbi:hypothetical protein J7643_14065 [bacterium]|nr:hypothetical protein [bacterium]